MNKLLRARATKWVRANIEAFRAKRWTHEEAQAHLEAAWLAGARSLDVWHRKQAQRPVASSAFDSRFHTGVERVARHMGDTDVLVIPALNSSEPRPRPKVGERVKLLVMRDCFRLVGLRVGSIGHVFKDDGRLLSTRWEVGDMWIDEADVAVVAS